MVIWVDAISTARRGVFIHAGRQTRLKAGPISACDVIDSAAGLENADTQAGKSDFRVSKSETGVGSVETDVEKNRPSPPAPSEYGREKTEGSRHRHAKLLHHDPENVGVRELRGVGQNRLRGQKQRLLRGIDRRGPVRTTDERGVQRDAPRGHVHVQLDRVVARLAMDIDRAGESRGRCRRPANSNRPANYWARRRESTRRCGDGPARSGRAASPTSTSAMPGWLRKIPAVNSMVRSSPSATKTCENW